MALAGDNGGTPASSQRRSPKWPPAQAQCSDQVSPVGWPHIFPGGSVLLDIQVEAAMPPGGVL